MSRSFLIASGKGGVGKSTIASSLARAFCQKGLTVALLDADVGLRCADLMLNLQDQVVYDFSDVMEKRCTLSQALYSPRGAENAGLHLLGAAQLLRASEIRPKDFNRVTDMLSRTHDIVLVDCPAGLGRNLKITLESVETCVLVATPDDVSLRDAEKMGELMREYGREHPSLIMNRINPCMVRRGEMIAPQTAAESLDMPLAGVVPDSPEVYRALIVHKTAYDCGDKRVRRAFDRIAERLLGAEVPIPDDRPSPVERYFLRARSMD